LVVTEILIRLSVEIRYAAWIAKMIIVIEATKKISRLVIVPEITSLTLMWQWPLWGCQDNA